MGEDQRAIRDCNAALAIEPKNENALFVRGSSRQNLEDYLGAIEDFSDVLQSIPAGHRRDLPGELPTTARETTSPRWPISARRSILVLRMPPYFECEHLPKRNWEGHQPTPAIRSPITIPASARMRSSRQVRKPAKWRRDKRHLQIGARQSVAVDFACYRRPSAECSIYLGPIDTGVRHG
jgi:hypothetical protein